MKRLVPLACIAILSIIVGCAKEQTVPPGWDDAERDALRLIDEGKTADLVKLYEPFARDYPDFPEAHLRLGDWLRTQALELTGNQDTARLSRQLFERAVVHLEKAHSLATDSFTRAETSRLQALIHDSRGLDDPVKAVAFARRFVEESPKSALARAVLADRLRMSATRIEQDPAKQKALLAEADRLDAEAKTLEGAK